ncbi:MAG: siroheme synthase [Rhodospirillales bacterium]|nr:siroheme synthase [Rhodospirillales bacterium]MDE2318754.1 siroheme synthase [Rhodospirillales bacterium]
MIPLALDPSRLRLGLAGAGTQALRRLRGLRAAGAGDNLLVFTADPELAREAGRAALPRLPDTAEISQLNLLWIVGLDEAAYRPLAEAAHAARVLVNVEDVPEFCDFNSVAEIRRGDLLLTISTNGQAPGLAGAIRKRLEACFPENWASRVKEIAALRQGWREERMPMAEAAQRISTIVEERCWLSCPRQPD